MRVYNSTLALENCDFSGNVALIGGGGVWAAGDSTLTVRECLFEGNNADFGGAVRTDSTHHYSGSLITGFITGTTFTNNRASQDGGALWLGGDVTIDRSVITSNVAGNAGGGLLSGAGSSVAVLNTLISANNSATGESVSEAGGAVHVARSDARLVNCTIVDNTGAGTGEISSDGGSLTVLNSILWNPGQAEVSISGDFDVEITFSDVLGGFAGEGNIDEDPRFVDAGTADYRLTADSPCSDAGTVNATFRAERDLDGVWRPAGPAVDMGAFEFMLADTDGDGIADANEGIEDTDEDGTPDFLDTDSDNDGLPDAEDGLADSDQDGIPDFREVDSDGDGLLDGEEVANGMDHTDPSDADADPDGDGISSRDELTIFNTHPMRADTDGDGIGDGLEISQGFDPLAPDGLEDLDGDGLPTAYEFRIGTDPREGGDPPSELFVSKQGDDASGLGSVESPWRTIAVALTAGAMYNSYGIYSHPVVVNVSAGTYGEALDLVPQVRVVGAGRDQTTIESEGPTVVNGAEGAGLANLKIALSGIRVEATALLRMDDVAMNIDNVVVDGGDNLFSIGILISGPRSSSGVIQNSLIRRLQFGIQAVQSAILIRNNLFDGIRGDAIFIRLPDVKQAGDPGVTLLLGDADDPETGFNEFRFVSGSFIVNANPAETKAEMNDWGVFTQQEIAAKMEGPVDFMPFIGASGMPQSGEGDGEGGGEGEGTIIACAPQNSTGTRSPAPGDMALLLLMLLGLSLPKRQSAR